MLEFLQGATLMAATISVGLMAGVFYVYAHAIMPGLRKVDDRSFVASFQAIDRAIINPWFIPVFIGALVLLVVATALHAGEAALPWIAAALVFYLATFAITMRVNVPLNDALKAAGDPDQIDVAAVRERFGEERWARFNTVRAVACTVALGCLAWGLVEFGRM
jgi:uncharacterized membrane protein